MPARQTTKVLDARGSFAKHPERKRARANEPKPTGPLGDPPSALNATASRAWMEIVANCPPGVLTQMDRHIVEMASKLIADMRGNWKNFGATKAGQLRSCLSLLGMTPVDRSRLKVEQPGPTDDPWQDL